MTDHHAHILENITVPLLTAIVGVVHYVEVADVLQALAVGAGAGFLGGIMKGVGHLVWRKAAKWLKLDHHDEQPK